MKVVAVSCPHCGARLRVESTILYVRCEYCGTTSRLEARTRMLQRVVLPPGTSPVPGLTYGSAPAPRPVPPPPIPVPAHMPAPAPSRAPVFLMLVIVCMGGASAFWTSMRVRDSTARAAGEPAAAAAAATVREERHWIGDGVIVADLDRNAVPDFIGRSVDKKWHRYIRIAAIDGATGKPMWESDVVSDRGHHGARLVLDGDLVLVVENHTLRALAAATGLERWSAKLDERITRMCAGDHNAVHALGADNSVRSLRRSDGLVVANEAREACDEVATDEQTEGDRSTSWADTKLAEKHGLTSARRVGEPGGAIFAGSRAKGTPVAMLAAIDAKGKLRWKAAVSPNPVESDDRIPRNVVVGQTEVCCTYSQGLKDRAHHTACFALADGKRLWDVTTEDPARQLRVVGRALLAVSSDDLMLFDLRSGARRWRF